MLYYNTHFIRHSDDNVILQFCITHQHGGSKIELLEELGDEDVDAHKVVLVVVFDIADDVSEPLVMFLSAGYPDEVNL